VHTDFENTDRAIAMGRVRPVLKRTFLFVVEIEAQSPRAQQSWQAHVDAGGRQGDEKAQQQGEGHGRRRNTRASEILWSADLCQRHLNWRRSAIDIEHPSAILEAF
jgi:hypothetical protein